MYVNYSKERKWIRKQLNNGVSKKQLLKNVDKFLIKSKSDIMEQTYAIYG